ncbi:MAG TPA: VanW family protein [Thermomicrobiales bacterium]|nr:VanW family protein [Thermomicrobiales bacterium]
MTRLTSRPITLVHGNDSWRLSPADLARGIVLPDDPATDEPWLDPWWIEQLVDPIILTLDIAPMNATLGWDDGLYVMSPGTPGQMIDRTQLIDDILAAAASDDRSVSLRLERVTPDIDGTRLDELGISELVAQGDTSFVGSSWERGENVRVSAYWVSQTLIAPGATFSYNQSLGPITVERGFVEGKIIMGDWFTSAIGGGACQVSTTVYRAALLAGLPFGEWHPHSSRVGFYELDGWTLGFDAAIYQAESAEEWPLDLTFVNTTGNWLLLQLDVLGERVVASLYGTAPGWGVGIDGPWLGDPIPPPDPVERTSADLAPGTQEVTQMAQEGIEATIVRTVVSMDGSVLAEDSFYSRYEPMPQVTLVGV